MSELEVWADKLGHMQPEEIRKLMQDEGIQGIPRTGSQCVLARFLKRETGVYQVDITSYITEYAPSGEWRRSAVTPGTVCMFIDNFDSDRYPELVEKDDDPWTMPNTANGAVGSKTIDNQNG